MSAIPKRQGFLFATIYAFFVFTQRPAAAQLPFEDAETALRRIDAQTILAHMAFLADDRLEGRESGQRGFQIAANYVAAQFRLLELEPLLATGKYFQPVLLRNAQPIPAESTFAMTSGGDAKTMVWGEDILFEGDPYRTETALSAPVAFVGFGVTAPDQGYDDYTIDVRGKIILMLSNAPASFPEHERAYYGSVEVKQETAIAHGAVGILEVRTEESSSWNQRRARIEKGSVTWLDREGRPNRPASRLLLGFLSPQGLEILLGGPGSVDELLSGEGVQPLPGTAEIRLRTRHSDFTSPNVIGRLPGSDPRLAREHVVYTAHLDHVGIGEPVDGDSIYNGAVDNASGVAAVLAIARGFALLPQRPPRSILFVATTAEEPGLVGSNYFANQPPAGSADLVAAINIDGATLMTHPIKAVTGMGAVHSSLGRNLADAAAYLDLTVRPEPIPLLGSDHYPFVLRGIPALWVIADAETGDPNLDGRALDRNWMATRLHTPQDDMHQPLDFGAAALLARLMFLTGYQVAMESARPAWNEGDFIGERFRP